MSATKSPHIEQECIFYYFIIKWHKYKILLNVYVLLINSFFFFFPENRAVTFDCEYFKNYFSLNYP